ncbi:MAG: RHS repeat-associated core domain-containing protein [Lysobacter sp.]
MTIAAKHFDPQLGIDIHTYLIGPLPTPHLGIVLDPFDYIPLIGGTVQVHGVKRATAGCGGLDVHIPVGGLWLPPMKLPGGPQFDDEIFMGSQTVSADGEPFSRITMPVLACNLVGMVPPIRLKKPGRIPLSLVLPTTINLAIPNTVNVGGPPTVSLMALAMRGGLSALGAIARKSGVSGLASAAFKKLRQHVFGNMKPGFLKCKVLRAEPVDIRDGSVSVSHEDFAVPGRLPLAWPRHYGSADLREGECGHGWMTPADIRLERFADGSVLFVDLDGAAVFPATPAGEGEGAAVRELVDGARLIRERDDRGASWVVRTKAGLRHVFRDPAPGVATIATQVARIERVEDLCGNSWTFERQQGHLVRIVESGPRTDDGDVRQQGRFLEVDSRHGRIERIQLHDPATGLSHPLVSYRYDAEGDLIAAVDALGAARTFEYRQHHMLRHTDRVGLSFHYGYNRDWQVVHAWGDGGLHDYRFHYDRLLNETEITDSLGHVTIVKFDENRLPLCEIDPLDGVTVFEYDELGRTTAVVDPMGLRTGFEYDECGNLLKLTRPDGSEIANTYDENDALVEVIDQGGNAWRQHSDAHGMLLTQIDPLGATTRYDYDRNGQLHSHTNPRGAVTRVAFDRHGQLQTLVDALGHASSFEHDALGRLRRQVDPLGQATVYDYDAKGRLLSVSAPGGGSARCEYDAEDQLARHVDESGVQTRLQYVGIGQVGKRLQADGHSVEYHYDTEEQLVGLTNQRGERYQLKRDALGRIVEEIDYWGQSRRYRYDAAGRLTATVDPLGQTIAYTTDPLGRITGKSLPDIDHPSQPLHEAFRYDARGQLVELRNRNRLVKRAFDAAGQLLEELQDGFCIAHRYDGAGNRIARETSAGNHLACEYDLRNQVVAIGINDEAPITLQRDALGRATREQLSERVQRQFQYDARSLLTAQTVLGDSAPLFDTHYDYDRAGNLSQRSDSEQGGDSYHYDVMGRLLQHTDPKGRIAAYLNDPAGDRLNTRVSQVQMRRTANGGDHGDVLWTREGSYDGVHYVFDRAGDLVRRGEPGRMDDAGTLELRWDANHRLAESRRDGQATRYGYDPLGRRVFKRNPTHTTWFFWDGDALLGEVQQANDEPDVAPVWVGNVANLLEVKQRQAKLKVLHLQAREYVYYPTGFMPLAVIDAQAANKDRPAVAPTATLLREPQTCSSSLQGPLAEATGFGEFGCLALGQPPASITQTPLPVSPRGKLGSLGGTALGSTVARNAPGASQSTDSVVFAAAQTGIVVGPNKDPEVGRGIAEESIEGDASGRSRVFHYHVDPNGCPVRITDVAGVIAWSASYAAWGPITQQHECFISNPLRFQGQYFDTETGLSYNRYRYYDPDGGQYVAQDPIGLEGGVNIYAYAPNPGGWIDPLGLTLRPGGAQRHDVGSHSELSPGGNRAPGHTNTRPDRFVQSHHVVQDEWAKRNITGYRSGNAPTILLQSASGHEHAMVSAAQRRWRAQLAILPGGKWGSTTLRQEMAAGYRQLVDAGVPASRARRMVGKSYQYFSSLGCRV